MSGSKIPLPSKSNFELLGTPRSYRVAYDIILDAERLADNAEDEKNLTYCRVVGFLLITLWEWRSLLGDAPSSYIVGEMTRAAPNTNLNQVVYDAGTGYTHHLIRSFRKSKGPVPWPSNHASCPSFDTLQDMINDYLDESPNDYRTTRKQALVRDGFRCVISGSFDRNSFVHDRELQGMAASAGPGFGIVDSQCCHILSESTTQGIDPDGNPAKRNHASHVFSVLSNFGLEGLVSKFMDAGGIHDLTNVLTLRMDLHSSFDNLDIWLEPTQTLHEYKLCFANQMFLWAYPNINSIVKFTTQNAQTTVRGKTVELPLPDSRLLAIHAACARVAHMSGAAEYLDKWERDLEDSTVLARDGSSAALLSDLLRAHTYVEY